MTSNDRMTDEWWIWEDLEGRGCGIIKIVSLHLPEAEFVIQEYYLQWCDTVYSGKIHWRSSETSVNFYRTTRRHIPDDSALHIYSHENLKSQNFVNLLHKRSRYIISLPRLEPRIRWGFWVLPPLRTSIFHPSPKKHTKFSPAYEPSACRIDTPDYLRTQQHTEEPQNGMDKCQILSTENTRAFVNNKISLSPQK
jgi:hypothetical protein